MSELELRLPALDWSLRAGAGELDDLSWVDDSPVDRERPFTHRTTPEGPRYRHVPYSGFLPPAMLEAARDAAAAGQPTTLQALVLMMARAEWLTASREHLWTSASAVPALLAELVEAYGIDSAIHRADPVALASLLAHLPRWHAQRGDARRALELFETALDRRPDADVAAEDGDPEAFVCHDARWWGERGAGHGELQLADGVATLTDAARPTVPTEDVELRLPPDSDVPQELLRLLPVWATVRLLTPRAS